ncbi:MAG: polyisoprenoid-binding protein [Acidobacteria bacterium]|nr:MAG: polyisoprenoid-binding protein [Acidobacteriota bacterium]
MGRSDTPFRARPARTIATKGTTWRCSGIGSGSRSCSASRPCSGAGWCSTCDAASIDTGVADRDVHLRSADFLDVDNNPKITFRSTRVEGAHHKEGDRFRLTGDLEIRGKAIPVTLDATFGGVGKDPWGKQRAGFAARAEVDRREWGLRWNQALETAGILVGNTVKIEIEAQAVAQEG